MAYTGTFYRGVDYSPTWSTWVQVKGNTQTNDSDMFNDAFASLWANGYQSAPIGPYTYVPAAALPDASAPSQNSIYRNDLGTIATDGFHLIRLYDWGPNRGTTVPSPPWQTGTIPVASANVGLDHYNFLKYASAQNLKVVVPVSDYFLSDDQYSWAGQTPDSNYSFGSAPVQIRTAFIQFLNSITDPTTGKIHSVIPSIAVGNEGDLGQGISDGTTASQFLARTNWWIYNLHQQINGAGPNGPDGLPVINGSTGPLIQFTATMSNADAGAGQGGWWADLINGVVANTTYLPIGYTSWPGNGTPGLKGATFGTTVPGLSTVDSTWASYYYNSLNIQQDPAGLKTQLTAYDNGTSSAWPYFNFSGTGSNTPLMLMEVFPNGSTNAAFSVAQAKAIEAYLAANAGTTNLMGYNFFEYNDEPGQTKWFGLYNYSAGTSTSADTGTTSTFFDTYAFPSISFPVDKLTAAAGPGGSFGSLPLWQAWTDQFPASQQGTAAADKLIGTAAGDIIIGGEGNDNIDGGKGFDIVRYTQQANNFTIKGAAGSNSIIVQDKIGIEGTDTLTNIEQIRFTDKVVDSASIAKAASLPAAQILKVVDLFTAGLNRAPDAQSLDFFAGSLADGASLGTIAKAIFSTGEAAPIFSLANSNPVFVNLVYQNALGRAPDAGGLSYWVKDLDTGHIARTDFVTALIAGARAPSGGTADAQYIANKEAVGAHFALTQGLNNLAWAKAVEANVTGTAASVTAANAQTDAIAGVANTAAATELVIQITGIVP